MSAIRWDDVAYLYDAYVTATCDVPYFVAEARASGGPVLELMAGTGRLSLPLVRAGVALTCVDASGEMLARLCAKLAAEARQATVVQADVRRLDLGQAFELALLPFNSFSELVDPGDQELVLAGVRRHLRPGARFICALHNPAVRRATVDGRPHLVGRYATAGGALSVWSTSRLGPDGVVEGVQEYEEYDAEGVLLRRSTLDVRFALVERCDFEERAVRAGFRVADLFGDYDRSAFRPDESPYMIFVLDA